MEFSSLSSRWIEQQDDDKEARVMYERERKIFSINLSSAVPVSSVGNGTDVMVDRGRLLSLVNVCVCVRACVWVFAFKWHAVPAIFRWEYGTENV